MRHSTSRRAFLSSVLGATAVAAAGGAVAVPTNKRNAMLALLDKKARQPYIPAAFFIHFDEAHHFGPPAVQKHLDYFRYTGMDFVKIQYERSFPPLPAIQRPEDWKTMPSYPRRAVADALGQASRPFILGADCTLPSDISWDNIRTAIAAAHAYPA